MATLEQKFRAIQRESPQSSSLINFSRAVSHEPLSKSRVAFYFRKLVEKGDYEKDAYKQLVDWLVSKTAPAEIRVFQEKRSENRTKNAQPEFKQATLRLGHA